MKTIFKHTLLSLVLLTGASTTKAQVKIGSSPTTIAPTSNLEVQATNGKKVIVDKAVGTVQVENLPTGAATNKIVTADPTGVLQQVDASTLAGSINKSAKMSGGVQNLPTTVQVDFTNIDYDTFGGVADVTSNKFIIPETGWYSYSLMQTVLPSAQPTNTAAEGETVWVIRVVRENALGVADPIVVGINYFNFYNPKLGSSTGTLLTNTMHFNAGDKLGIMTMPCSGCGNDTGWRIWNTSLILKREL